MIAFVVVGRPAPAGSKRAFPIKRKNGQVGVSVADANPRAKLWQRTVAAEAMAHPEVGGELMRGPIALDLHFFVPRPKSHIGARGLRPSAPPHPVVRPDVLKLARGVEDALTGVVWHDDSQIVRETLAKSYGEPARVEVTIEELPE